MLCYYADCPYAEYHILFTVMLNVIMLCVVMLNVVMLSLVPPWLGKLGCAGCAGLLEQNRLILLGNMSS